MRNRKPFCAALAGLVLAVLVGAGALAGPASGAASKSDTALPVDLNTASADELAEVPGIGPTMAQRIVDWREQNGPFERVEDLMKVKGIGEKSIEKLRPYVKVSKAKSR